MRPVGCSFVWMASYTQPTEPSTHVDRTDAIGRRVGRRRVVYAADRGATHMDRTDVTGRRVVRGRYRRATVARQMALRAVSCRAINQSRPQLMWSF